MLRAFLLDAAVTFLAAEIFLAAFFETVFGEVAFLATRFFLGVFLADVVFFEAVDFVFFFLALFLEAMGKVYHSGNALAPVR